MQSYQKSYIPVLLGSKIITSRWTGLIITILVSLTSATSTFLTNHFVVSYFVLMLGMSSFMFCYKLNISIFPEISIVVLNTEFFISLKDLFQNLFFLDLFFFQNSVFMMLTKFVIKFNYSVKLFSSLTHD